MVHQIELVMDFIVPILSLAVFVVFYMNVGKFVAGESKKIFIMLTIFLGLNFLRSLFMDYWEITQFLQGNTSDEKRETIELIAHIIQLIGLAILIYTSMIFKRFAKKLEKVIGD